jgi:phage tail sheath protein FI
LSTYKTPDVYIKEVSLLPPSVAEVATAIPAFIGYTEKAERNGTSLRNQPFRVKSLLEYQQYFGGAAAPKNLVVDLDDKNNVSSTAIEPRYYLYDSLQVFFANGGGACYIISVGDYVSKVAKNELIAGLDALRKEDEPTMIVIPDAMLLQNPNDIHDLQQRMLAQCEELQDRFAILDVKYTPTALPDKQIQDFRNGIGMRALKYGAAYYPYVRTTLPFSVRYKDIQFKKGGANVTLASLGDPSPITTKAIAQLDNAKTDADELRKALADAEETGMTYPRYFDNVKTGDRGGKGELVHYATVIKQLALRIRNAPTALKSEQIRKLADALSNPGGQLEELVRQAKRYDLAYHVDPDKPTLGVISKDDFPNYLPNDPALTDKDLEIYGKTPEKVDEAVQNARPHFRTLFESTYNLYTALLESAERTVDIQEEIVRTNSPILQRAIEALGREASVLPPSGAVAGVYAYVDNSRGVWKAPANVSLSSVVEPVVKLDSKDQENLNVDVDAGKSVNAIRTFAGKGTLVWGARTLSGNDNEWRYVSVRRFYNMAEESIKKSTYWAVFEPNDPNTWIKVRSMIENYLTQKWRDGALTGGKPDEAFFVKLGLGTTMTPVDVLEGRMIVEIGMAVVRPAEFIILKFSHKMQTA